MADLILRHTLGRHVHRLRRARGWTQEALARRSDLSPDTIRRLEKGVFMPGIDTVVKPENDITCEVIDLLGARSPREQTLAMNLLRVLFANLDGLRDESIADDEPNGDRKTEPT